MSENTPKTTVVSSVRRGEWREHLLDVEEMATAIAAIDPDLAYRLRAKVAIFWNGTQPEQMGAEQRSYSAVTLEPLSANRPLRIDLGYSGDTPTFACRPADAERVLNWFQAAREEQEAQWRRASEPTDASLLAVGPAFNSTRR